MELGNNIIQSQNLLLTPTMQQALQMLRMTSQELTELINRELEANPMLETGDINKGIELTPLVPEDVALPGDDYNNTTEDYSYEPKVSVAGTDKDILSFLSTEDSKTFTQMLIEQLMASEIPPDMQPICKYIIYSLNRKGYLPVTPEEISMDLGISVFDVMQCLYVVQSLEPLGVGARTLEECLVLQLAQTDMFNSYTIKLVRSALPLLANNDISSIAKVLGCNIKTAEHACQVVKSLNPIPSRGYNTGDKAQMIIPDGVIKVTDTEVSVIMNDSVLPELSINNEYKIMLKDIDDKETQKYIKANILKAQTLINNIDHRKNTINNIITYIATKQADYLMGKGQLAPMTMNEVAEALSVNVSTISRGVQGKYVQIGNRAVAIKSFFSTGYTDNSGSQVSAENIKAKLQHFIEVEDKLKPLSDEDLRKTFEAIGIPISRRTIAKYRGELGIDGSTQRKIR